MRVIVLISEALRDRFLALLRIATSMPQPWVQHQAKNRSPRHKRPAQPRLKKPPEGGLDDK